MTYDLKNNLNNSENGFPMHLYSPVILSRNTVLKTDELKETVQKFKKKNPDPKNIMNLIRRPENMERKIPKNIGPCTINTLLEWRSSINEKTGLHYDVEPYLGAFTTHDYDIMHALTGMGAALLCSPEQVGECPNRDLILLNPGKSMNQMCSQSQRAASRAGLAFAAEMYMPWEKARDFITREKIDPHQIENKEAVKLMLREIASYCNPELTPTTGAAELILAIQTRKSLDEFLTPR